MPLARIEIEQIESTRWIAEVEVGGFMAKRVHVTGNSYDDIMTAVMHAYSGLLPMAEKRSAPVEPASGSAPLPSVAEPPAAGALAKDGMSAALFATPHAAGERRATERASGPDGEREALVAAAASRGIEVDRRWGLARLREVVRNA